MGIFLDQLWYNSYVIDDVIMIELLSEVSANSKKIINGGWSNAMYFILLVASIMKYRRLCDALLTTEKTGMKSVTL